MVDALAKREILPDGSIRPIVKGEALASTATTAVRSPDAPPARLAALRTHFQTESRRRPERRSPGEKGPGLPYESHSGARIGAIAGEEQT